MLHKLCNVSLSDKFPAIVPQNQYGLDLRSSEAEGTKYNYVLVCDAAGSTVWPGHLLEYCHSCF